MRRLRRRVTETRGEEEEEEDLGKKSWGDRKNDEDRVGGCRGEEERW